MSIKGVNFQLSATNNAQGAFNSFNKGLSSIQRGVTIQQPLMRSWNAGLNSNRRAVQQLGFQMSDFAIQVAGGQSAMLAFVQQGGQILQFFGPFGAVMAALLAVFGSLYIAMTKTGTAIDQLYPFLGVLEEEFRGIVDAIMAVIRVAADMGMWIVQNLDLIIITASVAVGFFGVQWVAAMIAAAAATWTLSGAIAFLTTALIRTGIGALIVLVGYLIERFLTLARGVGGVGNAIKLVYDVFVAAFNGIGLLIEGMKQNFYSMAQYLASVMLDSLARVLGGFMEVTWQIADGLNALFNTDMFVGAKIGESITSLKMGALGFEDAAVASAQAADSAFGKAAAGIQTSWDALMAGIAAGETGIPNMPEGTGKDDGKGGGSATSAAEKAAKDITTIFEDMQKTIGESMLSGFKALVSGAKSFGEVAFDILSSIADKIIDILMTPIFDSIAGSLTSSLLGGFGISGSSAVPSFAGGGYTGGASRSGGLDGQGGFMAMLHPNESVIDHAMGGSGGSEPVTVHLKIVEGSTFGARVEAIADERAVKVTREGIQEYDNKVLPVSLRRVGANPRIR